MAQDSALVERVPERSRFEIRSGGDVAGFAAYQERNGAIVFTHTEVDDSFEGQGIGGKLVRAALDDVRAEGKQVVPECPFVRSYIAKHEGEYGDLVQS